MSETCLELEPLASVITTCQPHFAATSLKLLVSASRLRWLLSVCAKPTFSGVLVGSFGSASSACAVATPNPMARASSEPASGRICCLRACLRDCVLSDAIVFLQYLVRCICFLVFLLSAELFHPDRTCRLFHRELLSVN